MREQANDQGKGRGPGKDDMVYPMPGDTPINEADSAASRVGEAGANLTVGLGANERGRDAAWFSLVMNAAAEIEDAANCLRDSDAKRVAYSAAKYYRDAANALWVEAVPNN